MSRERDADCIDLNRNNFDVQYKQRVFVVESRLDSIVFGSRLIQWSFYVWLGVTNSKVLCSSFNEIFSLSLRARFPSVFARTCQHELKSFCMRNSFSENPFISFKPKIVQMPKFVVEGSLSVPRASSRLAAPFIQCLRACLKASRESATLDTSSSHYIPLERHSGCESASASLESRLFRVRVCFVSAGYADELIICGIKWNEELRTFRGCDTSE